MHTLTLLLFTMPSTVAVSTVDAHSPTTRSKKAPAEPVGVTVAQFDVSYHATRDAGAPCCST